MRVGATGGPLLPNRTVAGPMPWPCLLSPSLPIRPCPPLPPAAKAGEVPGGHRPRMGRKEMMEARVLSPGVGAGLGFCFFVFFFGLESKFCFVVCSFVCLFSSNSECSQQCLLSVLSMVSFSLLFLAFCHPCPGKQPLVPLPPCPLGGPHILILVPGPLLSLSLRNKKETFGSRARAGDPGRWRGGVHSAGGQALREALHPQLLPSSGGAGPLALPGPRLPGMGSYRWLSAVQKEAERQPGLARRALPPEMRTGRGDRETKPPGPPAPRLNPALLLCPAERGRSEWPDGIRGLSTAPRYRKGLPHHTNGSLPTRQHFGLRKERKKRERERGRPTGTEKGHSKDPNHSEMVFFFGDFLHGFPSFV
ncbi:uncharacterized protein LOC123255887 [Gracilinanus agilis]|uniref:uncharacterized protein LOC123255887 n=1 Tax=Gracilinanus agilis TaxID=191870 RepID=UPI001CFD04A1|nr:uncharacterized protein LOC123255887 [Gracilinanus agilis]